MSTDTNEKKDTNVNEALNKELENVRLPKPIKRDTVVTGKVTSVSEKMITIDVGYRSEGLVIGPEMYVEGERKLPVVGEEIMVYVINDGGVLGSPRLSIKKTGAHKKWIDLENASKTGEILEALVTDVNTGGVMVQLPAQIKGFVPASHLDQSRLVGINSESFGDTKVSAQLLTILQPMVGQKIKVKVLEVDKKKARVLLSERQASSNPQPYTSDQGNQVSDAMKAELISKVKVGDVMEATVTGVATFGLFVNANNIEGLVHNSQVSWDKGVEEAKYKVGDKVSVKVIGIDESTNRVAYSIKAVGDDPWNSVVGKYRVGQVVNVEVTKLTEYGAFVKLEEGVSGLIHNSEVDNNSSIKAADMWKEGDKVELKISSIDPKERHIALSRRSM